MFDKNEIKNFLYLSEYKIGQNKNLIKEYVENLVETKQTEQQAIAVLKKGLNIDENNARSILNSFINYDTSKNQVLLIFFSGLYIIKKRDSISDNEFVSLISDVSTLYNEGKIKQPTISNNSFVIGDKTFNSYLKFSEYIHGLVGMSKGHEQYKKQQMVADTNEPPIFPTDEFPDTKNSQIEIYDGNEVGKCIKYTTGGLTGRHYSFCIGQPANSMWQSYRDTKTSTFYYVIDKSRTLDDPLHIIVVDITKYGIELTDANNNTGSVEEFGEDVDAYMNYLKSRGVPVDQIFKNKPKTDVEKREQEKLGNNNPDLNWFKSLTYEEKSKYIGRGHLLSNEQFQYLWNFKNNDAGFKLLNSYLDTGQPIPEAQFNILVGDNK